ncbi:MAG TPA: TonB-dependent receptor, partial [Longimicrobium sp.]
MKRIIGLSLALALGGTAAAAQNGPPQQRPAGAPQQRPGGPPGGAAQQAGGEIRGTVLDATTGRPLPSASVAVWSRADSTLAGGAVTRADGSFRVQGLRPGRYFLRTTHLGHSAAVSADITVADRPASVAPIRLAASAIQLEGVTATAERSEVRMSADRNTYAVRDMPTATGGNATDVLRNVPAVEVDQDGRVSLRGNQNVAVQINGRVAPMRGDQLGQFLQQLPAGMVDRVEVVPNPSAKYDPEGMAGIVNIVMKQNVDLGLSGGATLAAGTNNRYNGSGNLGYQAGRMTLFGSYGFFADGRETRGFNNRTNLDPTRPDLDIPIDYLNQLSEGEGRMRSHTLNTSAEM